MRIWSLHPQYLDAKGLVACWRETLLAKNVLEGNTIGYRHHPQLIRFRQSEDALRSVHYYLFHIWKEAERRGYRFDPNKFLHREIQFHIQVTRGQMEFERNHLLHKLQVRDTEKYQFLTNVSSFEPHPLFRVVVGEVEEWEII